MSTTQSSSHAPVRLTHLVAEHPRLMALGLAARVPTAMLPLAVLLALAQATGSFAVAGGGVALVGLGGALGGPVVGLLADRVGRRVVVPAVTLGQVAALVGLVVVLEREASVPVLLALSGLAGLLNPAIGSLARALWSGRGRERADRASYMSTVMGWEAAADELSFVVGPIAASLLTGTTGSTTCLVAIAVLAAVTQTGFALLPGSDRAPARVATTTPWTATVGRVAPAVVAVLAIGSVFGAVQATLAAGFETAGRPGLTGLVYGCLGVGSALSGLAVTRLPAGFRPAARLAVFGSTLAVSSLALQVADGPVTQGLACLLVGLSVSPVLATAYLVTEQRVSASAATTAMAVLATTTAGGVGLGAALAGRLVDAGASGAAYAIPVLAGLVVLGCAAAVRR